MPALPRALLLALVLAPLAGCAEREGGAAATIEARLGDDGFQPPHHALVPGSTVAWTNGGALTHELHASDGLFRETLAPGGRFAWTFEAPGSWDVYCPVHDLRATVVVAQG